MTEPLWTPSAARVAGSEMDRFRRAVERRFDVELDDSVALHRWSVEHLDDFWSAWWDHAGVVGERGGVAFQPGDGTFAAARWFPDARLNHAENLLAGPDDPARPAILAWREDGQRRSLSWDQLRSNVAAAAAALTADGVGPGDRVAAWMPNVPETVVVMLATLAVGAVFSSTSPDFGTAGVVDRFGQIRPAVLVAADGYRYGGKVISCLDRLGDIVAALPTVRRIVVVGSLAERPSLRGVPGAMPFGDWVGTHADAPLRFTRQPFDHPGFILYSSGTTGPPKCIVHRGAGILLQHLKEHRLHGDVKPADRVFYFTTCGWMMWNWLTSALGSKASIVLFDGSPFHPSPAALFDVADRHDVTLLGISAKYVDGIRKAGLQPVRSHRLDSLRTICSTGSPLSPEGFAYLYESVKPDVHVASISGGTDLCGCFVGGDPTRPVYVGEIQGPAIGMAVDVYDEDARPCGPGQTGELVCTRPFPSTPIGFWDDDGSRYQHAYFERFPGVWAHGDFASWTEHGGMVIHGRSDATLNAGGVRIGTAEIYRVVEQLPEVAEAIAVGQPWEGDTRIVLFVRLAEGAMLDEALTTRLRHELRTQCSPRHVPARILEVADVPRTRSGKIVELAVADVVSGRPVRNTEALANPEALAFFADRPELAQ
jgi:acetoacetyl-CoA synthetase